MEAPLDRFQGYSWHQSHDQATVLLLVPYGTIESDVNVAIEENSLVARVRGQPPIVKGRLYGAVDTTNSMWQLERAPGTRPARARTISTASSRSSYALVSDPEQNDVFSSSMVSVERTDADSEPDSEMDVSSPAFSSSQSGSGSGSGSGSAHGGNVPLSQIPQIESLSSSVSSVDSLHARSSGRLLTLHLEKTEPAIWPVLISGPAPVALASPLPAPANVEPANEAMFNADPTSLGLLGLDYLDVRKDKSTAFEYFLRSWLQARAPLATLKLVTHFVPVHTPLPSSEGPTPPGSIAYWIKALGGAPGLARLYLEAGLTLQLEGASALHHGPSAVAGLSSIRSAGPPTASSVETWRRDRDAARRYFDRARALDAMVEVPSLASDTDDDSTVLGLRMPELPVSGSALGSEPRARRRRDREKEREKQYDQGKEKGFGTRDRTRSSRDKENDETASMYSTKSMVGNAPDVDGTWYLYIPGLLGAGTALLAVAVIGAVSVSTWRRSQS
ncbi:hypothetical protein BKA62DRAFT_829098 [Auriculariales sp. MPI-PUGE-AT-0066]|nr:hypothetical protein BKA62DRAFT_829098 [Auriculariales sp. MPI-PUGE-AT-0066]